MKSKTWKKIISMAMATTMLLSLAPVSAMAAEKKTIKNKWIEMDFNGYVDEDGAKTFKQAVPPKGVDLDDYDVDEYATEWLEMLASSGTLSATVDKLYTVGANSALNFARSSAWQDKELMIYTEVYLLDDNGDIAYCLEYSGVPHYVTADPSKVMDFNNIEPTAEIEANHFFVNNEYSDVFPTEKLLYVIDLQENWESLERYGFIIDSGAPDTGYVEEEYLVAKGNRLEILVNGKQHVMEAYNINGNNYVKLRDVAVLLNDTGKGFNIVWQEHLKAIELIPNEHYTPVGTELQVKDKVEDRNATVNTAKIYKFGEERHYDAYTIGGNTYFKLRDLGDSFDFHVGWNNALKTVTINTYYGYGDDIPEVEQTKKVPKAPVAKTEESSNILDNQWYKPKEDLSNVGNSGIVYPSEGQINPNTGRVIGQNSTTGILEYEG